MALFGLSSNGFGQNAFFVQNSTQIPPKIRKNIEEVIKNGGPLSNSDMEVIAKVVMKWAKSRGATHFAHWFQPLTGNTAEKHNAFLTLSENMSMVEKLSVSNLLMGEPDASSFPHGGARSTFEARGYTIWDFSSPMFVVKGRNDIGTLCIPSSFVSYNGISLDMKMPLMKSISFLKNATREFLRASKIPVKNVVINCGAEQEYFLIDKSFFFKRPDLVMSGKAIFGTPPAKNQQLEDHYFGDIPERILFFMQDLDAELYKVGIPSVTRHNEVAPAQFEVVPLFMDANVAADQNQLLMQIIKKVADRHGLVALLNERPFSGINGSGKHLNWSVSADGRSLLDPGENPGDNYSFLAFAAMVTAAVEKHGALLAMSISSYTNDCRLGGHEAPPNIISVFLGDEITNILENINRSSVSYRVDGRTDVTDRNRTSPFAFSKNRFEFRSVGSSASLGWPLTILNSSVASVITEGTVLLKQLLQQGKGVNEALAIIADKYYQTAKKVVFNGDGYSASWVKEAVARGLHQTLNTPHALVALKDEKLTSLLVNNKILSVAEIDTRYNVYIDRYIKQVDIEVKTLLYILDKHIIPDVLNYKYRLLKDIEYSLTLKRNIKLEEEVFNLLENNLTDLVAAKKNIESLLASAESMQPTARAQKYAQELLPIFKGAVENCNNLEAVIPDKIWQLPTYFELLYLY